eukprot:CAMPEP_0113650936 /NCGR_PEP_ID=MMETSP0017_2-20120614/27134_1 /TAXON_ID=2856 /ORGANISM="Cylindrotheca closterium" /LENGTH=81 /DNA_ID=CAMNT_0000563541 /DNA_START=57 /DNA_END=298 /DNA_ORIENTATION=+ /assembly_acc=CAM_ASM_000147
MTKSQQEQEEEESQTNTPPAPPPPPPWAWIKAVNNILANPPFEEPTEMPVQLLPWLYLSDEYHSIRQINRLLALGVTHVLS